MSIHSLIWLFAQVALLCTIFFAGLRGWDNAQSQMLSIAGGLLMLFSLVIAIKGICDLGRNLSPGPLPLKHNALVTKGIYSRVRHPLYSSLILLVAGWSVFTQSFLAGLGALALFAFLLIKAKIEEIGLKKIHSGYEDYSKQTGRFFPRLLKQNFFNQRTR